MKALISNRNMNHWRPWLIIFLLLIGQLGINAAVKVGDSSDACDGTTEGSLRYSTANGMQLCSGSTWSTFATTVQDYILLADVRSDGVAGGTCSTSWATRNLNTIIEDDTGLISLTSNVATFPAGTYECDINADSYNTRSTQIRLYNVSDAAVIAYGMSTKSDYWSSTTASLVTRFTLAATKNLRVDNRCEISLTAGDNEGIATTFTGSSETYMYIKCKRY